MTGRKQLIIQAMKQGHPYTYKFFEGGDLASMRALFKYGQTITMSPVDDFHEVRPGDIVLVEWRGGNHIIHPVQEIQGDQFLIVNSLGKINGWVPGSAILGKVTQIVDPEPTPAIPQLLERLSRAYHQLAARCQASPGELARVNAILDDFRWYAERLGAERWQKLPRQNKWSFESNLWYLVQRIEQAVNSAQIKPMAYYIDQGKWVTGFAAEVLALFEGYDWDYLV